MTIKQSVYQSIALDIAKKIVNQEFPVGSKLSGRSLLSCQYSVSPETIRKSVSLLKDSNVVQVSQGKEITITSKENAGRFVEGKNDMMSGLLQEELELVLAKKQQIDKQFEIMYSKTQSFSDRLKSLKPLIPEEISIPSKSHIIGRSLEEITLWRHTGATLVAIRRGGELLVSPAPDMIIQENDRILVVGPERVDEKVLDFIRQNQILPKIPGIGRLGAISAFTLLVTESTYSALNILCDPMCQTYLALLCECA
ncbi:MAG: TrkA C-terminal domain-containing protein [Negativicutes bacterium]|nr:TrkA C-terminal domain-containing protein [Negativicutes bacterium]